MNRKPFWKRVNRGALLSAALGLFVLIYVGWSMIQWYQDRTRLKEVTQAVNDVIQQQTVMSEEARAKLVDSEEAQAAWKQGLEKTLGSWFSEGSNYRASAVAAVWDTFPTDDYSDRVSSQTFKKASVERCSIVDDTATVCMQFVYDATGSFYNYTTGTMEEASNRQRSVYLTLVCHREDDGWKVYRLSSLYEQVDMPTIVIEGGAVA